MDFMIHSVISLVKHVQIIIIFLLTWPWLLLLIRINVFIIWNIKIVSIESIGLKFMDFFKWKIRCIWWKYQIKWDKMTKKKWFKASKLNTILCSAIKTVKGHLYNKTLVTSVSNSFRKGSKSCRIQNYSLRIAYTFNCLFADDRSKSNPRANCHSIALIK